MHYFETALKERKFNLEAASHYGLALALWRDHQYPRAQQALDDARKLLKHPLFESLAAQILLDSGKADAAARLYEAALARTPNHIGLQYGLIQCRLRQGKAADAAQLAQQQIDARVSNGPFYALLAEANAQLGKESAQRQAQAEFYYRQGRLGDAITQLQLALAVTGSDLYRQSAIEARLKILRDEESTLKQSGKR